MKNKSVMEHQFSRVPQADIKRSTFNRSHGHKTTLDAGYLVPILVDEVLPGDSFNLNMSLIGRLATPLKPVMDNMYLDTFFFFVPNRLLWSNWQRFQGEREDPADSIDYTVPAFNLADTDAVTGSIFDYMGIPIGNSYNNINNEGINALHFRAYNLIFNEWFRSEDLQDSVTVEKSDSDNSANYTLLRRGKRHDYFTSCLPSPQKGDAIDLPLGVSAPIHFDGVVGTDSVGVYSTANSADVELHDYLGSSSNAIRTLASTPGSSLYADLSDATASSINELRQAFQLQRILEKDQRGGSRYTEIIKNHFGVTSPDARLQRPEFLGGSSSRINITPIARTTENTASSEYLGDLAGFGSVQDSRHGFSRAFTEHGVIIGLVSLRADLTYQQGVDRMWHRQTRYDFYMPSLAHLGEQAVLNKEIYWDSSASVRDGVFGYQERFAEYRYKNSVISGKFRSADATSLDVWHLSQEFSSQPTLSSTFIEDNPPIDRVVATPDEPHLILDTYFNMKCARPMPLYGVPGYIDHF